jgi:general secretion pathway protein F
MPRYAYRAFDADGRRRDGDREADSRDALARALAAEGLRLGHAEPVDEDSAVRIDADAVAGAADPAALGDGEARELVREVAALTGSGLPLGPGLRALAEELPRDRLRTLVVALADRIEGGESLESALAGLEGRFPKHLRGLVLAGTKSGRAAQVLGEFVSYAQVGAALRRSLWLHLAYPIALVLLFSILTVFVSTYIIKGFESIFSDFGINLPQITVVLLVIGNAVAEWGFALLLVPLGLIALGVLASRLLLDAPARRRLFRRVPLFGPLWRWTALAEFSHYLGLLVESSVPLATAVPIAAEGARDAELEQAGREIAGRIAGGEALGAAALATGALPVGFTGVLNWAEAHRSLPEALHMAGDIFEAQARSRARFIGSVVTVLTVVLVIWGCFFLVVALFLPLIQLISRLSG